MTTIANTVRFETSPSTASAGCLSVTHRGRARGLHWPLLIGRSLALLACLAIVTACVPQAGRTGAGDPSAPPSTEITVTDDPFDASITYETAMIEQDGATWNEGTQLYQLVGAIDRRDGTREFSMTWGIIYIGQNWRFYDRATLPGGRALDVLTADRGVSQCSGGGSCTYREIYAIVLPENVVQAARQSGLQVQVSGRGDSRIVTIPGSQVNALLDRMGAGAS